MKYMYTIVTNYGNTVELAGQTYHPEQEADMRLPELIENGWVPVRESPSNGQWLVLLARKDKAV